MLLWIEYNEYYEGYRTTAAVTERGENGNIINCEKVTDLEGFKIDCEGELRNDATTDIVSKNWYRP